MKILFGSDHAGFELKQKLIPFVESLGYEVKDYGSKKYDSADDYVPIVAPVGLAVAENPEGCQAIILGGSGEGEAMVANRFPGVRATVYYGGTLDIIKLSKEQNDANILSLGARFLTEAEAKEAVKLWLETPFSNEERHARRITQIDSIL